MAYRNPKPVSLRKTIAGLAVVSLILFLLPAKWTGGLMGLVQLLVPLQDAATTAVDAIAESAADATPAVSADEHASVQRQAAALAHQAAALSARVSELEREVEALTATRHWNAGGTRIGSRGRLIPARVVVGDILPWRSSKLITSGSLQGIPLGAAVLSNEFTIDLGDESGLQSGLAILLGEAFLGWVDKTTTHVSRVKLLSDPSVQMKVRIGRFHEKGFALADEYFWLVGRGEANMEICDVPARMVEARVVEVGDVVLSDPTQEMLPAALIVGNVTAVLTDRDNPLFVHLAVKPVLDPADLQRVYVYDPNPEPAP